MIFYWQCRIVSKNGVTAIFILLSPINLICRCQFCTAEVKALHALLRRNVKTSIIVMVCLSKNMNGVVHLFAKKYSVLIVASPPLRSKMALAAILGLKLALESANVTSKVWPFGLFAKPFFSGVIAGSHLKIPFFLVTQNL